MDAHQYLTDAGAVPPDKIDVLRTAIALSVAQRPDIIPDKYFAFCARLHDAMYAHTGATDAAAQVDCLRDVLCGTFGFCADMDAPNLIENGIMTSVIDRRKGSPAALSILAVAAARYAQFDVAGIAFPVHSCVRVSAGPARLIVDPSNGFSAVQAHDLRGMLKRLGHKSLELRATYFDALDNRDLLLRLHNFVKTREIEAEDYAAALSSIRRMKLFAPKEPRLLFDEGVILSRLERHKEAAVSLEAYLQMAPNAFDRDEVEQLIILLRDWAR